MTAVYNPINFIRSPIRRGLIPTLGVPKPQVLWIGCSSSGFHETQPLDLLPEEIIVHRNLGNILSNSDLSSLSSVEYALKILKVKHIVVCGHYGCTFVKADTDSKPVGSWLKNVSELYESRKVQLDNVKTLSDRNRIFAELHAWSQAQHLMGKENVMNAMRDEDLNVHAFMYDSDKQECVKLTFGN